MAGPLFLLTDEMDGINLGLFRSQDAAERHARNYVERMMQGADQEEIEAFLEDEMVIESLEIVDEMEAD
jgi:hypothetical protein